MVLPKQARKGKKAWRRNIDVSEVETFVKNATHQERRGPAVETLEDSDLFFVDTSAGAAGLSASKQTVSKKRRRAEARPLRSQLILDAAHKTKPIRNLVPLRKKNALRPRNAPDSAASTKAVIRSTRNAGEDGLIDLWADDSKPTTSGRAAAPYTATTIEKKPRTKLPIKKSKPIAPAVEIDQAGCSYNPDAELQQDALAELVAIENKKIIKKELNDKPWLASIMVPFQERDELDMLQVEAEPDDDNDNQDEQLNPEGPDGAAVPTTVKKTKKDRNKEKRRIEMEKELAARQALKRQRQQLDALPRLQDEVKSREQLLALELERKRVQQAEKAASQPPKLGKHKYEPPTIQVLTSDEVSGSLRALKACPMLATHRFKSLQRRGLVEPRKPLPKRQARQKVVYEKGMRTEKAVEAQKEVDELRKANQATKNKIKKAR